MRSELFEIPVHLRNAFIEIVSPVKRATPDPFFLIQHMDSSLLLETLDSYILNRQPAFDILFLKKIISNRMSHEAQLALIQVSHKKVVLMAF